MALQVSTYPFASSSAESALLWWARCVTVPSSFLHLHEPHAPSLQPYGRPMPWRMAAASRASSALVLKVRPLGCTVTWNGPAAAGALVMFRYPRRLASLDQSRDFALKPEPSRRPAGALQARARAGRRLRRRWLAGGTTAARTGPPAGIDVLRRTR